jgi:hypothetical protein
VLAVEPLLPCNLHLQLLLLLHLLLVDLVPEIEILLPGVEVFRGDGGEGGELGPLEKLYLLCSNLFLLLLPLALDEIVVDPVPGLLDNVEHYGFLVTVDNDFVDFLGDGVDVVAGDASDGLYLVFDGSGGILLGVLEHDADLVFELVALIWLAEHCKFVRRGLLQHLELIEVDVGQRCEFVVLISEVLDVGHRGNILFKIIK